MHIPDELKKETWFTFEPLQNYPPMCAEPPLYGGTFQLDEDGVGGVHYNICMFEAGKLDMWFHKQDWIDAGKTTLKNLQEKPELIDAMHTESDVDVLPKLTELSHYIINTDLKELSDKKVAELFSTLLPLQRRLQVIRMPGWIMETPEELFSDYILTELKKLLDEKGSELTAGQVFSTLVSPTEQSLSGQEYHESLLLADRVKQGEVALSERAEAIQAHVEKWAFLPFGTEGPAMQPKDVVEAITHILDATDDPKAGITKTGARLATVKKEQATLVEALAIPEQLLHLIRIARDIGYQKAWSKEHQYLGWYALNIFLKEAARRHQYTLRQVRYFLPHELEHFLHTGERVDEHELNERYKYGAMCITSEGSYFLTGDDARTMFDSLEKEYHEDTAELSDDGVLHGQTAVPGFARGVVKIVNSLDDMEKMNPGDILLSQMTIPEIVSAMKKAAAIVTDMGGITCHAAIVSRELGIPCVIGTKSATELFQDGDEVEVDASNGTIKKCDV